MISVRIWIAEFENQSPFLLRQKPSILSSQNLATGTQFSHADTIVHVPYDARNPIKQKQAIRMFLVVKIRRYWNRIDAFADIRLVW